MSRPLAVTDSTAARYTFQDPDVRLMLRVRENDSAAFEELVIRYQSRLVSLLAHLTGSRDRAEDLAQEVFLRVYRARNHYEPGSKFATWLFTIAHNVAANSQRGMSRRREVQLAPKSGEETSGNALDAKALAASGLMPTRQLDKAELAEVVRLSIATLPERQRMAVLLNKFEHLGYDEIAAVMQLTPSAVKSLLTRARTNLRDILEPYLDQGVKAEAISK